MAAGTAFEIQGKTVTLPVKVAHAMTAFATYFVPAEKAQALIDHTGLRVAEFLPGKAVCSLAGIDYKENELGQYLEVAIAFLVLDRKGPTYPPFANIRGLLGAKVGAYIHQLPVTAAFTCEAGQNIWGYPKFVTPITFKDERGHYEFSFEADGQHVMTLKVKSGGKRKVKPSPFTSFSYRNGKLYRTTAVSGGEGLGIQLGGATLTLGNHPMAKELKKLGLPKRAFMSGSFQKMTAAFGASTHPG